MRRFTTFTILTAIISIASPSMGQSDTERTLTILFSEKAKPKKESDTKEDEKDKKKKKKKKKQAKWKSSCENFGESLTVGKGPYGLGFFGKTVCKNIRKAGSSKGWILTIIHKKKSSTLSLTYNEKKMSYLKLSKTSDIWKYLGDKGVADTVSYYLLNDLPAMGQVTLQSDDSGSYADINFPELKTTTANSSKTNWIKPPKNIFLYDLKEEDDLFIPHIVGSGKIERHNTGSGSQISPYQLSPQITSPQPIQSVWIHNKKGASTKESRKQIKKIIKEVMEKQAYEVGDKKQSLLDGVSNLISETGAAGYVGVRVGKEVIPGSELVSKSMLVSALVEVRGGPIKGLRIIYDLVPKVSVIDKGEELTLEWSRVSLGTSIGINFDSFISRVDLTPKVGNWSFRADLPVDVGDNDAQKIVFDVADRTSMGLDIGIETSSKWYTLRFWASQDKAVNFGGIKVKGVTTTRYGIDTYFSGPSVFNDSMKLAYMGFYQYENAELSGGGPEDNGFSVGSVFITSGYLGGGVALSW